MTNRSGLLYAGGAFLIWGIVPLYFRALGAVSPYEIIAHRVLWSVLFLALLLAASGRGFEAAGAVLRQRRLVARLALTSALVAANWLTFVWAISVGRVLDTSLGYFLTPQVNVVLGFLILRERLSRAQWLGVLLAAAGVINQIVMLGRLPWISLLLAGTFGCYGLFRKQIPVDPLNGLFVETLVASPIALGYLVYLGAAGALTFSRTPGAAGRVQDLLLVLLGVVTAVPLMLFAAGAQRLRLVTVGFMQYIAPSMTFVLALLVFREPLGLARMITFVLIWAGILIYAADSLRAPRS